MAETSIPDDPWDSDAWIDALIAADKDDIENVRFLFDEFFRLYPTSVSLSHKLFFFSKFPAKLNFTSFFLL
jgi:outer membrane protein assembly factor BamD (BamD/ComL family)